MIVAGIYILIFSALIFFAGKRFQSIIPRRFYLFAFLAKIAAGFALTWIYTSYYPDRNTADIYKYYDDAKIMYDALPEKPGDYIRMVSGIQNDNLYFDTTYYAKMNNWYKRYDFGTYNDNHTIIRFNALIMPLAFGSFYVHNVFMCLLSFAGLWMLCHFFLRYFPDKKWLVFLSIFFIPSVLFWGSGVLKEGILLFSIGLLFFSFYKIIEERKKIILNLMLLLIATGLLLINKNYLLISLVPAMLCFFLIKRFHLKKSALFFCMIHLALLGAGYSALRMLDKNPLKTISQKQQDFINLGKGGVFLLNNENLLRIEPERKTSDLICGPDSCQLRKGATCMKWQLYNFNDTLFIASNSDTGNYKLIWDLPKAGSLLQEKSISPDVFSFIKFSPVAIYNVLLKPGLLSAKSILEKMAAAENIVIAAFLLFCILFADFRKYNAAVFLLCIFPVIILFLIIGFTTPIAGAIVRYKMPLLPLLLMAGINLLSLEKVNKLLRKKT